MKQPELDKDGYFKPIVICPQCGAEYPYYKDINKRIEYCHECGKYLRQTDPTNCRETCEYCGGKMNPETTLCPHCGQVTKRAQAQTDNMGKDLKKDLSKKILKQLEPTKPVRQTQTNKIKSKPKKPKTKQPVQYYQPTRTEDINHPRRVMSRKEGIGLAFTSGFIIFGLIITAIIAMMFL